MSAFWVCLPRFFLSAVEIFGIQAYDYICSLEQEVMNISHLVFFIHIKWIMPKVDVLAPVAMDQSKISLYRYTICAFSLLCIAFI